MAETTPTPNGRPLAVGDRVERNSRASYRFRSTVVAVFTTLGGKDRVVCESEAEPGLLLIHDPGQLVRISALHPRTS